MKFWSREISGWILLLLGLLVFYTCYVLLLSGRPIEAGPMTVIGIFLFRGGLHLLKVAVAARVSLQTQDRLAGTQPPARSPAPSLKRATRPTTPAGRRL